MWGVGLRRGCGNKVRVWVCGAVLHLQSELYTLYYILYTFYAVLRLQSELYTLYCKLYTFYAVLRLQSELLGVVDAQLLLRRPRCKATLQWPQRRCSL